MGKRTFLFILGTRPEAIKLAPLFLYFKKQNDFKVHLLNTQQQKQLSTQTLKYFGIKADFDFSVMSLCYGFVDVGFCAEFVCAFCSSLTPCPSLTSLSKCEKNES